MKLTIEEKACTKHRLTFDEVLMTLVYRQIKDPPEVFKNLKEREIITQQNGKFYVTQHWAEVLDEVLADSSGEQNEDRLRNLAIQMREIYPQGRMIDSKTGRPTPYYFRCNVGEVSRKLKTFFARYGEYTDEEILDATRRYVAAYQGNYQQKGFRLLKYFIFKDDVRQGPDGNYVEPLSYLLDYLENKEETEGVVVNTEDWTTKLI